MINMASKLSCPLLILVAVSSYSLVTLSVRAYKGHTTGWSSLWLRCW